MRAVKLEKPVDYRLTDLDLKPFMSGHVNSSNVPVFDLYGVVNHTGSVGGGHYVSYARHPSSGEWNFFNDSDVYKGDAPLSKPTDGSSVYILFYERKGVFQIEYNSFSLFLYFAFLVNF